MYSCCMERKVRAQIVISGNIEIKGKKLPKPKIHHVQSISRFSWKPRRYRCVASNVSGRSTASAFITRTFEGRRAGTPLLLAARLSRSFKELNVSPSNLFRVFPPV